MIQSLPQVVDHSQLEGEFESFAASARARYLANKPSCLQHPGQRPADEAHTDYSNGFEANTHNEITLSVRSGALTAEC